MPCWETQEVDKHLASALTTKLEFPYSDIVTWFMHQHNAEKQEWIAMTELHTKIPVLATNPKLSLVATQELLQAKLLPLLHLHILTTNSALNPMAMMCPILRGQQF